MTKALLFSISMLLGVTCVAQEQWTYTEFHPWYWMPSEESWIYVPNQPQYVWDATDQSWILNPMGGSSSFDLNEVADRSPLIIEMAVEGGEPMILTVNLSGQEGGVLDLGASSIPISYRYKVDAVSGSIQLFGQFVGDGETKAFSLLLDFEATDSGQYTLIGNLGLSSCPVCEFSGLFAAR